MVEEDGRTILFNAVAQLRILHTSIMGIYQVEELSWEDRYGAIFTMSGSVRKHFQDAGWEFDYYDPDTSYEEDVKAFVTYFDRRMQELAPMFVHIV